MINENVNINIDGIIIAAENNGTCYITDDKPVLPDNISTVIITSDDPDRERVFHNAEFIECFSIDQRYCFAFREKSPDELYREQLDEERDMVLDLISDQEYRLCLIELGII